MAEHPPIRVVIADDEPLARARVRELLDVAGNFTVVGEAGDGQSAVAAALAQDPEVIFLDIRMPDLDGFEVLDALEAADGYILPGAVVFVTGYDRYAIRAFDANAADYLLKPIEESRFRTTVERLRERLRPALKTVRPPTLADLTAALPPERRYLTRLVVPERGRVVLVPVSEVECLIAADNYVKAHTPGRVYLLRSRLSDLTLRLDPADFTRVHRSHVVAVRHIREIRPHPSGEHDLRLASGREVRASRAYRKAVQSLMTRLATAPDH